MSGRSTVEERFTEIAARMADREGVTLGSGRRGFGSDALMVNGRIFAMVTRGHLVLKLPPDRVSALIERRWIALAGEACTFVGQGRTPREGER